MFSMIHLALFVGAVVFILGIGFGVAYLLVKYCVWLTRTLEEGIALGLRRLGKPSRKLACVIGKRSWALVRHLLTRKVKSPAAPAPADVLEAVATPCFSEEGMNWDPYEKPTYLRRGLLISV
ncbi:hypothetical protein IQ22_04358 [Pseudomonas duriflava]|uniref:Uncharacterized protein n=1 Tax=Pseudomonas duriflava TaxID=459528 RepID=A0A562PSP2_9PSED|nr:hypothetical protein [Pseudomonas duriflava]TWI47086.1 hypothetical protein IQ22_04358 [Pseudomonas duriflava]